MHIECPSRRYARPASCPTNHHSIKTVLILKNTDSRILEKTKLLWEKARRNTPSLLSPNLGLQLTGKPKVTWMVTGGSRYKVLGPPFCPKPRRRASNPEHFIR